MADDNSGAGDALQTVKIGEVEYSMDDLSGLVADGQFKREIEEKQNTKLDKLMGSFTKLTEEKKTWDTERAELEKFKADKAKADAPKDAPDEATIAKAREELRKIGVFTKEDVDAYIKQEFPKMYVTQRETDKFFDTGHKLEGEIDGKDGRPKFVLDDVLEHMKQTGIRDPFKAYKDKYEDKLDTWKAEQLGKNKREGLLSDRSSTAGGKTPPDVRPTRANLSQLFKEAMEGK